MSLLDAIGWVGSAFLIYSIMQAKVLRFRLLNTLACLILIGFNAALGIWQMVAMNTVLCLINGWHIRALLARRSTKPGFAIIPVGTEERYLRHLLDVHHDDMVTFQPDLDDVVAADPQQRAFLVQRGDETAGVVLLRCTPDGTASVLLDYVTPKFRDLAPGKFLWCQQDLLRGLGLRRVVTSAQMRQPHYGRLGLGFKRDPASGGYVLEL